MIETPNSIITSKDWIKEPNSNTPTGILNKNPPIKDINKWPAIILAVSRKVKARGRMKFLRSSTNTIKLIKATGVPTGIKWVKKDDKDLTHLKIIIPNQRE